MTTESTFETVQEIVADALGVEPGKVTAATRLDAESGADSLDRLDAIMRIEEACGVDLPAEETDRALTVGELVALVDRKRAAAPASSSAAAP